MVIVACGFVAATPRAVQSGEPPDRARPTHGAARADADPYNFLAMNGAGDLFYLLSGGVDPWSEDYGSFTFIEGGLFILNHRWWSVGVAFDGLSAVLRREDSVLSLGAGGPLLRAGRLLVAAKLAYVAFVPIRFKRLSTWEWSPGLRFEATLPLWSPMDPDGEAHAPGLFLPDPTFVCDLWRSGERSCWIGFRWIGGVRPRAR